MSNSGNTTTTIIAIVVAGILIFIVPMATLTSRVDNVTQENVKLIVAETVTDIQNTGILTKAKYQDLENQLAATGNVYDVEIEIMHLDENPGKKTAQANYTKIGENVYYSDYTTQILNQLGIGNENSNSNGTITLKEGDRISITVKNQNNTTAQTLIGSLLGFSNDGEYAIFASSSGMINVNGNK